MSIHVKRAPTVPLTSYDIKRRSHLKWRVEQLANSKLLIQDYKFQNFEPPTGQCLQNVGFFGPHHVPIWEKHMQTWRVSVSALLHAAVTSFV